MKPNTEQPKATQPKPESKTSTADDLKSMPLPELEKKLASSPDGPDLPRGRNLRTELRGQLRDVTLSKSCNVNKLITLIDKLTRPILQRSL